MKKKYVPPRQFRISMEDAKKHGYTRGCAGCTSWFKGLGRQAHSESCRARFEKEMKEEAKVKRAKEQQEEFKRKVGSKRKNKLVSDVHRT